MKLEEKNSTWIKLNQLTLNVERKKIHDLPKT